MNRKLLIAGALGIVLAAPGLEKLLAREHTVRADSRFTHEDALAEMERTLARALPAAQYASVVVEALEAPAPSGSAPQRWEAYALDGGGSAVAHGIWDGATGRLLCFRAAPSLQRSGADLRLLGPEDAVRAGEAWLAALEIGGPGAVWIANGRPVLDRDRQWRVPMRALDQFVYAVIDGRGSPLAAVHADLYPCRPLWAQGPSARQAPLAGEH